MSSWVTVCGCVRGVPQIQGVVQDHAVGVVENLADQQLVPSGGGTNGNNVAYNSDLNANGVPDGRV